MIDYSFTCYEELSDMRIDKCISDMYEDLSRSFIQKLIKDRKVFVNDKPVKASYKVSCDDKVSFTSPDNVLPDILPENIPLDILYEDKDILVVNKPKGMVVHPAPGHYSGTLVNAVMYHCKNDLSGINGVMRPGIVHRIDMNTTGSILVCKNDKAHLSIAEQLKVHSIKRVYTALVHGVIMEDEGMIDAPIGRSEKDRKKMTINYKNGKTAVTNYKVLKRFDKYTLIECRLQTGRTHQIRVHLSSVNHPILGDDVYCKIKTPYKLQGQTLHAGVIGFVHPSTKEYIEINAPLPKYFNDLINNFDGSDGL
ncbi:MAG: RluA family pseudouridine synthase [Lachnospiraceae bacterium]|nr:RluA family pseudouridine synthase [Lachnospiraceae bacterium]